MQMPQRKLKDIQRLLSAFPPIPGDPALVLHNYLMVAEDWSADQVETGVNLYLKGKMPGFDGRFAPTAPMLASGCRKAAEDEARTKYLEGVKRPHLPKPDIEKTPAQRERAREQVKQFLESVASAEVHETTEETMRRRDRWNKSNAYFDPPQDDNAVMRRLMGYSIGAPESDEAAA